MGHLPRPAVPHRAWRGRHTAVFNGLSSTVLAGAASGKDSAAGVGGGRVALGPREGLGPVHAPQRSRALGPSQQPRPLETLCHLPGGPLAWSAVVGPDLVCG